METSAKISEMRSTRVNSFKGLLRISRDDVCAFFVGVLIIVVVIMDPLPEKIDFFVTVFSICYSLIFFFYAGGSFVAGRITLIRSHIYALLFVLFFMAFLSSFASFSQGVETRSIIRDIVPLMVLLVAIPMGEQITKVSQMKWLNRILLMGSCYLGFRIFGAASLFLSVGDLLASGVEYRIYIMEHTPTVFMPLFLAGLAVAVSEFRMAPCWGGWFFWGWVVAFLFITALLTYTRSMILGALVIILLPFVISTRSSLKGVFVKVAIVGLIAGGVLWAALSIRVVESYFFRGTNLYAPSVLKRIKETENALQRFAESPFLGQGPGYVLETDMPEFGVRRRKAYTHNYFSYVLLHYGALGLFTIVGILISLCSTFWLGYKSRGDRDLRKCSLASFVGLVGMLTYVQFQAIHKSLSFAVYLAILIAFAVRTDRLRIETIECCS